MLRYVFTKSMCVKHWHGEITSADSVNTYFALSSSGQYALEFAVGKIYNPDDNSLITDFDPIAEMIMNEVEQSGALNQIFECAGLTIADSFAKASDWLNELEMHFIDMGAISKPQLLSPPVNRRHL